MNYNNLRKNIYDVIKEEQIKLGYKKESIRLYYPLQSLNRFLGTDFKSSEMLKELQDFAKSVRNELGDVEITIDNERFCFFFSDKATEYVHQNTPQDGFLYDFIETVSKHNIKIEDIISLFRKYSDKVHFEEIHNGEFNYLIYFEDGESDEYRYCLTEEGPHITYHRFTEDDYNDFHFDK